MHGHTELGDHNSTGHVLLQQPSLLMRQPIITLYRKIRQHQWSYIYCINNTNISYENMKPQQSLIIYALNS